MSKNKLYFYSYWTSDFPSVLFSSKYLIEIKNREPFI